MARRQQRQFNRQSRPNRDWTGIAPAAATIIPASSKVLIATFVLASPGIDETILRTVGQISVAPDQTAAQEFQIGGFGLCIVTDRAVTVGITAIPDPVTEVDDDMWFVYVLFCQEFFPGAGTSTDFNMRTNYAFDSRAKRILTDGYTVAIVAANSHATHGLTIVPQFRMLSMVRGTG